MLRHRYYCISLATSLDRRHLMLEEFARERIDVVFFDGFRPDGTDVTAIAAAEGLGLSLDALRLTPGELGCYISHRRLWQLLAQSSDEAYVIFEDDMKLAPGFKHIVRRILARRYKLDVVRLGPLWPSVRSYAHIDLDDHHKVYWTKRTALGTGCYTITQSAARALLRSTRKIYGPVDFDIDRCWAHGQKVQLVHPCVATPMDLPSTIGDRVPDCSRDIGARERWTRRITKHRYRLTVTLQRYRTIVARIAAHRLTSTHR